MRHLVLFLFLIVMLTATVGQTPGQGKPGSHVDEVKKLERAWLDAYEQRDAEAMNRIVADDFVITFGDGSMQTKPQIIEQLKSRSQSAAPSNKFRTEEVQARVYGDTVILMGRVITEWQRDGKPMSDVSRYTDTYVKRNGKWQVVASHLSAAKP